MKLTCTQENFSRGLNIVARLSDKNSNLPILNNVLLQARKDGLLLISTNLEIGIKTKVRGKIESEGDFTIQAKLLSDFVNTLKKENVGVELVDKTLHLKGENHQTTIRGLESTDFPVIPEVEAKTTCTVPTATLIAALTQTLFAVSSDESRPELNGVYIILEGQHCVFVATDSYRLVEKTITLNSKPTNSRAIIVPSKTLQELVRILPLAEDENVVITINDTQILFTCGQTQLVSRIIAGDYPDYKQIIPTSFKNNVEFKVYDMVQAVKTTSLFCKQGINDVRISLDKRFSDIAINAENNTLGKNISNVQALTKDQELDIVFNYKFLLDGLSHLSGDRALLKTNEPTTPAVLSAPKEDGFVYVIMPIKQ
jgi:DNA polymerase-3 subunit beta